MTPLEIVFFFCFPLPNISYWGGRQWCSKEKCDRKMTRQDWFRWEEQADKLCDPWPGWLVGWYIGGRHSLKSELGNLTSWSVYRWAPPLQRIQLKWCSARPENLQAWLPSRWLLFLYSHIWLPSRWSVEWQKSFSHICVVLYSHIRWQHNLWSGFSWTVSFLFKIHFSLCVWAKYTKKKTI